MNTSRAEHPIDERNSLVIVRRKPPEPDCAGLARSAMHTLFGSCGSLNMAESAEKPANIEPQGLRVAWETVLCATVQL